MEVGKIEAAADWGKRGKIRKIIESYQTIFKSDLFPNPQHFHLCSPPEGSLHPPAPAL